MYAIGMSPDYRSGWDNDRCAICHRRIYDSRYADNCGKCGREVCRICIADTRWGVAYCVDCEPE